MAKSGPIVVDGWLVQQVLMYKSPPEVTTITGACKSIAHKYGVTPETLRCYASKGIPSRSKIARIMLQEYADIEAVNNAELLKVHKMEEELIRSIERVAESFEHAGKTLIALKESVKRKEGRK
jgi:hypothetical protein